MEWYLYLGGPIKGGSYEQANSWREETKNILRPHNIICFSPMRHREHRKQETSMQDGY